MAHKIINKFKEPKFAEFSRKDLVVDIKNGILYYKSNLGVHRISSGLATNTFGSDDITNITNFNIGIPDTFKGDGIRIGDSSIDGNLTITNNIIINESASFGNVIPHPGLNIEFGSLAITASGNQIEGPTSTFLNGDLVKITTGSFTQTVRIDNILGSTSMSIDPSWLGNTISTGSHDFFVDPDLLVVKASDGKKELVLDRRGNLDINGNLDVNGNITADLTLVNTPHLVYYNNTTGLFTHQSSSFILPEISSSISGAFTDVSSSLSSRITSIINGETFKATGQRDGDSAITGSLFITNNITASNGLITNDLIVGGTIIAQEFHTEFVSASILFTSGSTQFGNSSDDIHLFSGSINVKDGHITASNNISASGHISASKLISAGPIHGFLDDSTNLNFVYFNNTTKELTQNSTASFIARALEINADAISGSLSIGSLNNLGITLLSSSAQIANAISGSHIETLSSSIYLQNVSDTISGSFTDLSASIAETITSNAANTFKTTGQRSGDSVITGSLLLTHLTASDNISASGYISASTATFPGLPNISRGSVVYFDRLTGQLSYDSAVSPAGISGSWQAELSSSVYLQQVANAITGSWQGELSSSVYLQQVANIISGSYLGELSSSLYLQNVSDTISGSFTDLSASIVDNFLLNTTDTLTGDLFVTNHITASGNISASGTIFANNFQSAGGDVGGISFTDDFNLTGNLTASGNISSSGHVSASKLISAGPIHGFLDDNTNANLVFFNDNTNELTYNKSSSFIARALEINAPAISGSWQGELSSSVYLQQVSNTISGSYLGELSSSLYLQNVLNVISGSYLGELSSSVYLQQVSNTISGSYLGELSSSLYLENISSVISGSWQSQGLISSSNQITSSYSTLSAAGISGSFLLNTTDTLTGELFVTNHITASGNISSSGHISASKVISAGPIHGKLNDSTNLNFVYFNDTTKELTQNSTASFIARALEINAPAISGSYLGELSSSLYLENVSNVISGSYLGELSSSLYLQNILNVISGSYLGELSSSLYLENISSVISGSWQSQGLISSSNQITSSYSTLSAAGISGSFLLNTTDTLTGDLFVTNNITASGNISSSGHVSASKLISAGPIHGFLDDNTNLNFVYFNDDTKELTAASTASFIARALEINAPAISGSYLGELSSSLYLENISSVISGSYLGELSSSLYLQNVSNTISGSYLGELSSSLYLENISSVISGSWQSQGLISSSNQITSSYSTLSAAGISGSFLLNTTDTLTGELFVTNHITASGNISSSGHISASKVISAGPIHGKLNDNTNLKLVYFNSDTKELTAASTASFIARALEINAPAISGSYLGELSSSLYLENVSNVISGSYLGELSSSLYLQNVSNTISGSYLGELSSSLYLENISSVISGSWQSQGLISSSNQITSSYSTLSAAGISGSFLLNTTDTLTGELFVTNHITASGNISASGHVSASKFSIPSNGEFAGVGNKIQMPTNDQIDLIPGGAVVARLTSTKIILNKDTSVNGHITASGNISSSGHVSASKVISAGPIYGKLDGNTNLNLVYFNSDTKELTADLTASFIARALEINADAISGSYLGELSSSLYLENISSVISGSYLGELSSSVYLQQVASTISGSFTDLSASIVDNFLLNTTDTLDGDLTVTGKITAQEFHTEFVSASIIFSSGSTQFGDTPDDTHVFSGSINIIDNGHITASGNVSVNGHVSSSGLVVTGTSRFEDDITLIQNKKIIFDSEDTFIKSTTAGVEVLQIGADDDIVLMPDDDLIIKTETDEYARFLGTEKIFELSGSIRTTFGGHITASGNISASGHVSASKLISAGPIYGGLASSSKSNVVFYNELTGELTYATSESIAGSGGVGGLLSGSSANMTASGNISSSANISAMNIFLPGQGKISFDDSLDGSDQFIQGNDHNITIDGDNQVNINADLAINLNQIVSSSANIHIPGGSVLDGTANVALRTQQAFVLSGSGDLEGGLSFQKPAAANVTAVNLGGSEFDGSQRLILKLDLTKLETHEEIIPVAAQADNFNAQQYYIGVATGSNELHNTFKTTISSIFKAVAGTNLVYDIVRSKIDVIPFTGTISASVTGDSQGQIKQNGINLNVKDLQVTSNPTFNNISASSLFATTHITASENISASGQIIGQSILVDNNQKISSKKTGGALRDLIHMNNGNVVVLGSANEPTRIKASAQGIQVDEPITMVPGKSITINTSKIIASGSSEILLKTAPSTNAEISINNFNGLGQITASSTISASGHLFASASSADGNIFHTVMMNTASGQFFYTGSYGSNFTAVGISGSYLGELSSSLYLQNVSNTISGSYLGELSSSLYLENISSVISGSWQSQGLISSSNQITSSYSTLSAAGISGSFLLNTTDTLTGELFVTNHITASGNISASGDILFTNAYADDQYRLKDGGGTSRHVLKISSTNKLELGNINFTEGLLIPQNITASNSISASGTGSFASITASGNITATSLFAKNTDNGAKIQLLDSDYNAIASFNRLGDGINSHLGQMVLREESNIKVDIRAKGNSYIHGTSTKFGIGTTSPGEKLEVVGNISASGRIYGGLVSSSKSNVVFYNDSTGELTYATSESIAGSGGGGANENLTVDNSTIELDSGTTYDGSSAKTISVKDDGITYAKIQNVSATNRILGRDTVNAGTIEELTPTNVRGMLGIATGANSASLDAGTGISVSSVNAPEFTISFMPDGDDNAVITSNGLGAGFTVESNLLFDGTDLSIVGGDIIAFAASDKRFKDNITPITNPIDKIMKIGGYTFDWNKKQNTYTGQDVGVIAQEIEYVLPEVVETRKNGYKAVKYDKIIPLLIESIKEQQKQIKDQQKQINKLKKQINAS